MENQPLAGVDSLDSDNYTGEILHIEAQWAATRPLDRTEWDFGTQHGAARAVEYPNANGSQSRGGYTLMVASTGQ